MRMFQECYCLDSWAVNEQQQLDLICNAMSVQWRGPALDIGSTTIEDYVAESGRHDIAKGIMNIIMISSEGGSVGVSLGGDCRVVGRRQLAWEGTRDGLGEHRTNQESI